MWLSATGTTIEIGTEIVIGTMIAIETADTTITTESIGMETAMTADMWTGTGDTTDAMIADTTVTTAVGTEGVGRTGTAVTGSTKN